MGYLLKQKLFYWHYQNQAFFKGKKINEIRTNKINWYFLCSITIMKIRTRNQEKYCLQKKFFPRLGYHTCGQCYKDTQKG